MNRFKLFFFLLIIFLILCFFPLEVHSKEKLAMTPKRDDSELSYTQKCLYNVRENIKELRNIEELEIIDEITFFTYLQVASETASSLIEASIYAPNVRPDLVDAARKICDYEFALIVANPDVESATLRCSAVNLAYCCDLLGDSNKREFLYSLARKPSLFENESSGSSGDTLTLDFFSQNESLFKRILSDSNSNKTQSSEKLVSGIKFVSFKDTMAAGERYFNELIELERLKSQGF